MTATSAIRNFVIFTAAAVGTGVGVGTVSTGGTVAVSSNVTVFTPGPLYGPTVMGGLGPTPQAGAGSSGTVITDPFPLNISPIPCTPPLGDALEQIDLATFLTTTFPNLTETAALDGLALRDATNLVVDVAITPSTTIGGKTIIQRVKGVDAAAKAAAEIIIKGCFANNDTVSIYQAIQASTTNAFNVLQNPTWTKVGVGVNTDGFLGIVWTIILDK